MMNTHISSTNRHNYELLFYSFIQLSWCVSVDKVKIMRPEYFMRQNKWHGGNLDIKRYLSESSRNFVYSKLYKMPAQLLYFAGRLYQFLHVYKNDYNAFVHQLQKKIMDVCITVCNQLCMS